LNNSVLFLIALFCIRCNNPNNNTPIASKNPVQTTVSKTYANTIHLSDSISFVFTEMGSDSLYYKPLMLIHGHESQLTEYDIVAGYTGDFVLSPNHRFVKMDFLDKGTVDDGTDSFEHEHYFCAILDTKKRKIVHYLESDSDGSWNTDNHWLNESGEFVFVSPD
jgi:hypothetical protein